jgi:hypothetical protein
MMALLGAVLEPLDLAKFSFHVPVKGSSAAMATVANARTKISAVITTRIDFLISFPPLNLNVMLYRVRLLLVVDEGSHKVLPLGVFACED